MRYTLRSAQTCGLIFDSGWRWWATWTQRNSRAPQPRFTITCPAKRPRPSSYARLAMHLRDTGQTGGVIQTRLGEMRWGDQCEPWVDPFVGRCCCGKEEDA